MKNLLIIILGSAFIYSCDPDIPGEGITLPVMEFGFKVSPDTAYIKLGDTIILSASIPNTLDNGIEINDGIATISSSISYSNEIPIETFNFHPAYENEFIKLISSIGNYDAASTGQITNFYAIPMGDSIKFEIKIVPLIIGTYSIHLYSKFYEGSQGKTRTQPKFDMEDVHWDLYQVPEYPAPNPSDEGYYKSYRFAVYE